jgi:hypothetical protein
MGEPQNETNAAEGRSASKALLCVENFIMIEQLHADGTVADRYKGPSDIQLKAEHEAGKCGAFCGYCYDEAMAYLDT